MAVDPEHHPVGGHGLGPHVVGRRVVVRRVLRGLTGPSGGPALTDVLGVCEAWDGVSCVVRPEGGKPVVIAIADVVSGKPVPPRASVRDRVSPHEAQLHGSALFADLVTEPLGDWVLRHSAGFSARRANSVLAFGGSGVEPAGDDVDRVLAAYERPVAAVLTGSPEAERFARLGWVPESDREGDSVFLVAGVAQVARAVRDVDERAVAITADEQTATARTGTASGVAALDAGDWLGFRSIEVDVAQRRRGLGLQVMAALLGWGAERGATTAYLQVLDGNAPAQALYARLGFREHHRYRYLTPPAVRS